MVKSRIQKMPMKKDIVCLIKVILKIIIGKNYCGPEGSPIHYESIRCDGIINLNSFE
jgi:hypothetical protein